MGAGRIESDVEIASVELSWAKRVVERRLIKDTNWSNQ